jgi:hypothetical protein
MKGDNVGKEKEDRCIACNRNAEEVPLIAFRFRGKEFAICPQHLPVLIHDPRMLAGKLPGAEKMDPADHQD